MRLLLPCLVSCLLLLPSAAAERPPNILFILADDLGYGDVGCYNPKAKAPTPHLDRLAAEGMRFTDAHSPSTVCTPSRYSILTGEMAFRINYRGVFTGAGGPCLIRKDQPTLSGMLQDAGYKTALFGKWHIGLTFHDAEGQPIHEDGLAAVKRIDFSRPISDGPRQRGFDRFFGTASCPTTDWLYAYIDGDRVPVPPTALLDRDTLPKHPWSFDCRGGMKAPDFDLEEVDEVFLEKSLRFLEDHHRSSPDQPFFLFHSTQAVHLPSFPSRKFRGKSGAGPHGDFLLQFDATVGRLLAKLDELGLRDNTLVLVSSDNGPEVSTTLNMRKMHGHDGARPWRGFKRDNWEGGHRVPLIACWPGTVPAASTCDQTVCLTDLMATCAAIIRRELPADAAKDSINVLPLLKGGTEPVRDFTLHQTNRLALAIRQGDWKFLDHKGSGGNNYQRDHLQPFILPDQAPDTPGQLYNLRDDPGETKNLVEQHPDRTQAMKALLEKQQ